MTKTSEVMIDRPRRLLSPTVCQAAFPEVSRVAEVEAHITGTVWKIECAVGDKVEEGDTVAILESMKMEMPVEAEDGGTVVEIRCEEGQAVNEGDTLVVLGQLGAISLGSVSCFASGLRRRRVLGSPDQVALVGRQEACRRPNRIERGRDERLPLL